MAKRSRQVSADGDTRLTSHCLLLRCRNRRDGSHSLRWLKDLAQGKKDVASGTHQLHLLEYTAIASRGKPPLRQSG